MLTDIAELRIIARQLGAKLFDYQQVRQFGATELQNMIFELSRNDHNVVSEEIWNGYIRQSEKSEIDL